ncbi:NAD(P)/FAD-dependent oxidoreductase [Enterococcus gallinarum]|nr:NAD(P)/FAD-dependent oxidoreductase [Enterococcus gallinarum]
MKKSYDVIVIGAGTSGMMAAISAAENGADVLLIEKNKKVGKKLLMTGGGRCNVTNHRSVDDLIAHIPGNGKFLYSTFSQFNNFDVMTFFESHGVPLKEEDHGRMFPVTDKSKTIVEGLLQALHEKQVTLLTNTVVTKLLHDETQIQGVRTEFEEFTAPCVILTTGGRTYPSTGATGDGYKMAKKVGHTITPLYPTESPLISEEPFIKARTLQGISLQDIALSVLDSTGKTVVSHTMDLLFTHFGLSDPAALRCSSFVNQELKSHTPVTVMLDCFPEKTVNELVNELTVAAHSKKKLVNALSGILPERLLEFFIHRLALSDLVAEQTTEDQLQALAAIMKGFSVTISKTFPLEKSFVTGGGIHLKEVNPKTMESKCINGLYFGGELLDINGYTGGFNITAAFCTGHVAGKHAAEMASYFHYSQG